MATHDLVKLFDDCKVRVFYDDESQLWYFCIADVVEILTESRDVPQYIKRMRQRDQELNSVWGTICTPHQFKSSDGRTDGNRPQQRAQPRRSRRISACGERRRRSGS